MKHREPDKQVLDRDNFMIKTEYLSHNKECINLVVHERKNPYKQTMVTVHLTVEDANELANILHRELSRIAWDDIEKSKEGN
jgi:hypothetical protein